MEASVLVSLNDPLSQERIIIPVRGRQCSHKTAFDKETFEMYNLTECPICKQPLSNEDLLVDVELRNLMRRIPAHVQEVYWKNGKYAHTSVNQNTNTIPDISDPKWRHTMNFSDVATNPTEFQRGQIASNTNRRTVDYSYNKDAERRVKLLAKEDCSCLNGYYLGQGSCDECRSPLRRGYHACPDTDLCLRCYPQYNQVYSSIRQFEWKEVEYTNEVDWSNLTEEQTRVLRILAKRVGDRCLCKNYTYTFTSKMHCSECLKEVKKGMHAHPRINLCNKCYRKTGYAAAYKQLGHLQFYPFKCTKSSCSTQ